MTTDRNSILLFRPISGVPINENNGATSWAECDGDLCDACQLKLKDSLIE